MHDLEILRLIVEAVASAAKLQSPRPLYGPNRQASISKLRDTTLFLIRAKTKLSFKDIGAPFKRDHSSILMSIRREEERLRRALPKRPDGLTLQQWHNLLIQQIDAAIAAEIAKTALN